MLEKLATFSEKLKRKGLFDISNEIDKSIKIAANYQRDYPGYIFLGYDVNTGGPWYQGEGRYWYLPPGGRQWIPYNNLPGQGGVGKQSLTEAPYTKLYEDPKTGYLTSAKFEAEKAKAKQEAGQMLAGTLGLAGTGLAAGYHLGDQVAKNWEIFNDTYLEMQKIENLISKAENIQEKTLLEKKLQQLGNKAMRAFNNFDRLSKFDPGYLSKSEKRLLLQRANNIAKMLKIDLTKGTQAVSKGANAISRGGRAVSKGMEYASKLGNLAKNSRFMQYFRTLPPAVQARVPQILQMIRSGASVAQIAATTTVGSTIIIALALYAGWNLSGGAEALKAVQQARQNDWRKSPALVSLQTRLQAMTPQQREQFLKNPANAGVVQALKGIGPEQIKSFWSTIISRNESLK